MIKPDILYSLQNLNNYNQFISQDGAVIFTKYIDIINEYIQSTGSIYMQDSNYNKYIIKKGIDILSHIFSFLILYTKNIELTIYYCKKSAFYYIEFINQMNGDNNAFLNLSLNDSALFVYKKSIFEINNDYRKLYPTTDEDRIKIDIINNKIYLHNRLWMLLIDSYNFSKNPTSNLFKDMISYMQKWSINVTHLALKKEPIELDIALQHTCTFLLFVMNKCSYQNVLYFINGFIKRIEKHNITFDSLNEKIYSDSFVSILSEPDLNHQKISHLLNFIFE
jgi:hypothetical protein